jgi:hypothetical protein
MTRYVAVPQGCTMPDRCVAGLPGCIEGHCLHWSGTRCDWPAAARAGTPDEGRPRAASAGWTS